MGWAGLGWAGLTTFQGPAPLHPWAGGRRWTLLRLGHSCPATGLGQMQQNVTAVDQTLFFPRLQVDMELSPESQTRTLIHLLPSYLELFYPFSALIYGVGLVAAPRWVGVVRRGGWARRLWLIGIAPTANYRLCHADNS